jgi:hypothetical protein
MLQIFDCIVMGPMSRVDFWDRGVAKDLEVRTDAFAFTCMFFLSTHTRSR